MKKLTKHRSKEKDHILFTVILLVLDIDQMFNVHLLS